MSSLTPAATSRGIGYDGEVYLLVTLTPPASLQSGENVTLKAAVAWLMCQEVCMPGEAALELTLPVDRGPPSPHPRWGRNSPRRAVSCHRFPTAGGSPPPAPPKA